MKKSEQQLLDILKYAKLPVRGSYRRSEVCKILNIGKSTFYSMVNRYEPDPITGEPLNPASFNSYMVGREQRVTFQEIVAYLDRNNTYNRQHALKC